MLTPLDAALGNGALPSNLQMEHANNMHIPAQELGLSTSALNSAGGFSRMLSKVKNFLTEPQREHGTTPSTGPNPEITTATSSSLVRPANDGNDSRASSEFVPTPANLPQSDHTPLETALATAGTNLTSISSVEIDGDTISAIDPLHGPDTSSEISHAGNTNSVEHTHGSVINHNSIVFWDGVYVQRESCESSSPWTWSQLNVRNIIDLEITERVRRNGSDQYYHLEYCLEILYAGKQSGMMRPAIVISTRSRKTKKRIAQCLSQSDVKKSLKENKLDLYILKTPIGPAAGPYLSESTHPTEPLQRSKDDTGYSPQLTESQNRGSSSGRIVIPKSNSLCGASILVKQFPSNSLSCCILGGFILIGEDICGLTALHPFTATNDDGAGNSIEDDAASLDIESSDEDTDEPFILLHDEERMSSGAQLSKQTSVFNNDSNIQKRASGAGDIAISPNTLDLATSNIPTGGSDFELSTDFKLKYQGPAADWAVFEAMNLMNGSDNRIGGHTITETFHDWTNGCIPVTTRVMGRDISGSLHPGSALYRMGPTMYELKVVTLEQSLQPGCSGAWVAHRDQLCGSIIVARHETPWVYVMPFSKAKEDVERVCGLTVRFPLDHEHQRHESYDEREQDLDHKLRSRSPSCASRKSTISCYSRRSRRSLHSRHSRHSRRSRRSIYAQAQGVFHSDGASIASTTATNAVPALVRDARSETFSEGSADTDMASSILGDGYTLESQEGVLTVPHRYLMDADLLCPFQILDCDQVFDDIISFKMHVFSHFRGHELPTSASCFLCDCKYGQLPTDDPALAWNTMLSHMVHDHFRRGQQLATIRTDFGLMRWMYTRKLISAEQFRRTQMMPIPVILPGFHNNRRAVVNLQPGQAELSPPQILPFHAQAASRQRQTLSTNPGLGLERLRLVAAHL